MCTPVKLGSPCNFMFVPLFLTACSSHTAITVVINNNCGKWGIQELWRGVSLYQHLRRTAASNHEDVGTNSSKVFTFSTRVDSIISQNTIILMLIAMRTLNLTVRLVFLCCPLACPLYGDLLHLYLIVT